MRKGFNKLVRMSREVISWEWPGYPFSLYGAIDFKTKQCYLSTAKDIFVIDNNWNNFNKEFSHVLPYQILGEYSTHKGSFLIETHMEEYKKYLKEDWDNFYIDNQELVRLYFSVYSAIREYKDTENFLYFMYDGDSEYVDVLVFKSLKEIDEYYKEYIKVEN